MSDQPKRRGRPPKPPGERRTEQLNLSLRPRDLAALDRLRVGSESRQGTVCRILEPHLHPSTKDQP